MRWFGRIWISIRGFAIWLQAGYPFMLLFLTVLGVALLRQVSWLHIWIILILGTTLTIAEMLNFAIEKLCNVVSVDKNDNIRVVKDLCAGAVLVAGLTLGVVGLWIILK